MSNYLSPFIEELLRRHIGQTRIVSRRVTMTADGRDEFDHTPADESAVDVMHAIQFNGFATDATTKAAVRSEEQSIDEFTLEPSTNVVPMSFYSEVSKRNPLRVTLAQGAGTPTVNYTIWAVHIEKDQLARFQEFKATWHALLDRGMPPPGTSPAAIRWTARPAPVR